MASSSHSRRHTLLGLLRYGSPSSTSPHDEMFADSTTVRCTGLVAAASVAAIVGLMLACAVTEQNVVPTLGSLFFLWEALGTPACLFFLLNCIIITLALTPSSSSSSSSTTSLSSSAAGRDPGVVLKPGSVVVQRPADLGQRRPRESMALDAGEFRNAPKHPRPWHSQPSSPHHECAVDDESQLLSDGPSAPRPKPATARARTSSSSLPSSPTKRATLHGGPVVAADELSDEDLRKRIEAFISKMNAQIKKEVATSVKESSS